MSKEAFVKFYNEYIPSNPTLLKEIDALRNEEAFGKLALEHGPKNGFQFTREEMHEVMATSKQKMLGGKELSDDQLSTVAGGALALAPMTVQIRSLSVQQLDASKLQPGGLAGAGDTVMCCW